MSLRRGCMVQLCALAFCRVTRATFLCAVAIHATGLVTCHPPHVEQPLVASGSFDIDT